MKGHIRLEDGLWRVWMPHFAMETSWPDLMAAMEYLRLIVLWRERRLA